MKNVDQYLAMWNRRGYIKRGPDDCILWVGGKDHGYGRVSINGEPYFVHRYLWEELIGPIQGILCHKCDVRNCIKLSHIYDGSYIENFQDWKDRQRKDTFRCGHDRASNTYTYTMKQKNRKRAYTMEACILCKRESSRLANQKRKKA